MVVDGDVDVVVAHLAGGRSVVGHVLGAAPAVHPPPAARSDLAELLDVGVHQLARPGPLVAGRPQPLPAGRSRSRRRLMPSRRSTRCTPAGLTETPWRRSSAAIRAGPSLRSRRSSSICPARCRLTSRGLPAGRLDRSTKPGLALGPPASMPLAQAAPRHPRLGGDVRLGAAGVDPLAVAAQWNPGQEARQPFRPARGDSAGALDGAAAVRRV